LAVGFGSTAGVQVIPALIKRFRTQYPRVEVELCEMGTEAQLEALNRGRIDIGIAYAFPHDDFESTELEPESLVVLLHREHPLASQRLITLKHLSREALILPSSNATVALRDAVLAECTQGGWPPTVIHEIQTAPAAFGLVSAKLGVALLPEPIMCMTRRGVVIRRIRNSRMKVRLRMLWRKQDSSPLVHNFLRLSQQRSK